MCVCVGDLRGKANVCCSKPFIRHEKSEFQAHSRNMCQPKYITGIVSTVVAHSGLFPCIWIQTIFTEIETHALFSDPSFSCISVQAFRFILQTTHMLCVQSMRKDELKIMWKCFRNAPLLFGWREPKQIHLHQIPHRTTEDHNVNDDSASEVAN